ncbi:MAG: Asp-tRNA(Asn)/Glu-tRNA(Gln) amidotransferase subunit GatB [Candidatus Omnitrophica bacterium]|nr:Asp-tRNA(Asn)/Glu-tRNA(Gln) amidotransferase subunit GatB [Candidatus Omnitrophota bacterium]
MKYDVYVGLEVHLQLSTKTKAFCSCSTIFGETPNSQTCPVCLGFPGTLPVLNKEALVSAIKVALALDCSIAERMKFDRKNYYYPDLPKNFQISQYDQPLSQNGYLDIKTGTGTKRIRIKRVHMEEDAGKLFHKGEYSLIDYNRSGTALLEIVSEPDISSPEEAYVYLTSLKSLLRYLDVSDCNMEEGSLRCDANISLSPKGSGKLGTKTELKNMNSFKWVKNALEYEVNRQAALLDEGASLTQDTRLWNVEKGVTISMRSKEEAHDYRYFPEPDLVPFVVSKELVSEVKKSVPELPKEKIARFVSQYSIPEYDAFVLTQEKKTSEFFEKAVKLHNNPKSISNWIMGDINAILNEKNAEIDGTKLSPANLAAMVRMIDEGIISIKIAKEMLPDMTDKGESPQALVEKKGLMQISDSGELESIVERILAANGKSVNDYKAGKTNALAHLVGQIMKETRGKANPKIVNEILLSKLGR